MGDIRVFGVLPEDRSFSVQCVLAVDAAEVVLLMDQLDCQQPLFTQTIPSPSLPRRYEANCSHAAELPCHI